MNSDEKVCPRCAETVKRAAVVCRFCGYEFGQDSRLAQSGLLQRSVAEDEQKNKARNGLLGCLGIFVLLALIGQCSGSTEQDTEPAAGSASGEAGPTTEMNAAAATPLEPVSAWTVSAQIDQLRGKSIHSAVVTSDNEVDFDFPYHGGSRLSITVRKHPKHGEDVIFQISDGQFVCGIYDCAGTINFGSGPEKLSLSTPADHDSKTLFATYGPAIIRKLRAANKVVVELPFYQEGNRQFTFDTKGLVWPPKSDAEQRTTR